MDRPTVPSPRLAEPKLCTGCSACRAVCPRDAIGMTPDAEGFLRPEIDPGRCVRCGLCERACPVLRPGGERFPKRVLAMRAKDDSLRRRSSSGGVFSLLARRTLSRGGIAFGAAFDESDWHVEHVAVESEDELDRLRGSKYVQSDVGDVFRQVRSALESGREVLFSGTPCQVAGLRRFLAVVSPNADLHRLVLVDVVCHGAPSPLAWSRYLDCRRARFLRQAKGGGMPAISGISFRDKHQGWKLFSMSVRTDSGQSHLQNLREDPFLRCFLKELLSRPSCFRCPFRSFRSGSDVTLGDYWGVAGRFPEMDDDGGTSLVLAASEAGCSLLSEIRDDCIQIASDYSHAVRVNPLLVRSKTPGPRRERFFRLVGGVPFDRAARISLRPTARLVFQRALDRFVALVPVRMRDTAAARFVKRILGVGPARLPESPTS